MSKKPLNTVFGDYDYMNKLSKEDREWLTKFNREYYFNCFDNNDIVVLINHGISFMVAESEREWWLSQPDLEMVSLQGKDLRKFRKIKKYYKTESGDYSEEGPRYKNTLHSEEHLKSLRKNKSRRYFDIYTKNKSTPHAPEGSSLNPEDFMIMLEDEGDED